MQLGETKLSQKSNILEKDEEIVAPVCHDVCLLGRPPVLAAMISTRPNPEGDYRPRLT
jgi:hypothetical protein